MEDIWLEALHQYLQSSEWYEMITQFVESHCSIFDTQLEEYDHGHYTVFREFVEISEQILNDMLQNLGGSLKELVANLSDHSVRSATGPRDDMQKEIVKSLLTFDSFPEFCVMMSAKSKKIDFYENQEVDEDDLGKLTSMGFDKSTSSHALSVCANFDEALQYLFDNPPPSPRAQAKAPPTHSHTSSTCRSNESFSFVGMENEDMGTQFRIANQIVDASNKREVSLTAEDAALLPWAMEIIDFKRQVGNKPFMGLSEAMKKRFVDLKNVIKSEQKRFLDETISKTAENQQNRKRRNSKEFQKTAGGAGIDGPANESERNLDYMFRRRDELSREIVDQRGLVVNFTRPPFRISDDTLEELYLFLKEIVHNGQNLDEQKDRIHAFVFSRIHSTHGKIVPSLLELMLLENEDYLLQRNISRLLNGQDVGDGQVDRRDGGDGGGDDGEDDDGGDDDDYDGGDGDYNDENDNEVDMAKLNDLHKSHARDLAAVTSALESEAERQRRELQERLKNRRKKRIKECRESEMMSEEVDRVERELREQEDQELARFDLKSSQRNRNVVNGINKAHVQIIERFTEGKCDEDYDVAEKLARELREAHLKDLAKMRESLEHERERQRVALMERLRKKRMQRLRDDGAQENFNKIVMEIDFEESKGLSALEEKFCNKVKVIGDEQTEYFAANSLGCRLSEDVEDAEDWMDHLAKLHSQHTKNLSNMQASLLGEKMRQQSLLHSRLQAARLKKLNNAMKRGGDLDEVEAECEETTVKMRAKFEQRFTEKLAEVEDAMMRKQDEEVVAMRTSIQKKKTVAFVPGENDFDFDNLASELIASHNRDLSNHEKVLDEEKQKQKLQLEEKLRKRKEARRRQLLSAKRDLTEVEIDEEIVLEERAVRNEWKEEREMNEYLDNELNDGVIRAVTRGGQFAEKGEFDNNWVNGEEEKVDESLERIKLKDVGKQNTMERNKETSKKLIKEHDEATKALIEDLKENRRASHQKMLDRLAKRRKETLHRLTNSHTTEEELEAIKQKIEGEEIKERVLNDRLLTLQEHKAIEEAQPSMQDSNGDAQINPYSLLDEIHEEYKGEREQLQQMMADERAKQKEDMKRRKRERKEKKKLKAASVGEREDGKADESDEGGDGRDNEMKVEDFDENEFEEEDTAAEVNRISKQHAEERETLELMNMMEQTRQKHALQQRLLEKKKKKKRAKRREKAEKEKEKEKREKQIEEEKDRLLA